MAPCARALTAKIRGRIALVTVGLLLAGGVTGSGPAGLNGLVGPRPAAADAPVAPITGCSSVDDGTDPAAPPAAAAAPAGRPAATLVGGAYQARLTPGATGAKPTRIAYSGAALVAGPHATDEPVTVGITPLDAAQLPQLDPGMTNLTEGPASGYQFTPHPYQFTEPVQVELPYDPVQAAAAVSLDEVYTFFYDEAAGCWRPLKRLSVDAARHVVVSETTHFTDMINATVTVPDLPQGASFDPTQIKGIQAASPATGVGLITPPAATNSGDAQLSYPIATPPGRAGVQPQLALGYSSASGDGWLGMGWNLGVPKITIDTKFGVPRYDAGLETETYLLGNQQLTPVANRTRFVARVAEKSFHPRVEGAFQQVIRHGDAPANYSWEITDKSGVRWTYGGDPTSVLTDDRGNIFEWALREMRDLHGNVMRYTTVRQDDPGIAGSPVPGRNLYLKKITYTGFGDTDGPYSVTFLRDRELGEARRPDVSIDARGGFKRVTADLLRRIEVRLNGTLIRRYDLGYRTGAFAKTLLASVSQFGEDGKLFTTHSFDYFDDIRDATGAYRAFGSVSWGSPDDNLRNGAVGALGGDAGEAGAINGSTSTSVGGHLYVGFGATRSKTNSAGVKAGFSNTTSTGLVALVDVDGDDLPDKVFRGGGGVSYRKNLSGPNGQPRFSDTAVPLTTLPGILSESSNSLTVGVEAYPGAVAVQLDHVDTTSTTDRYFADVNGDDIPDLVNGGSVLFGRLGQNGVPAYGLSADSPAPIGPSRTDASGVLGDFAAARERQIDSHPLVDSVRRWTAPYDGSVAVTGAVALVQDTSPARAAYTKADGVRVAVQHEDSELWSALIGPDDFGQHTPTGVGSIPVHRGDALYFRVGSRFDGAFDQVSWNPVVSYLDTPAVEDVNGLPAYSYRAAADFTLGGRTSQVVVPATGTLHLTGALTKRGPTTDDVTAVITQNGQPVFRQTVPAAQTGQLPIDLDVQVQRGQQLRWRLEIDSPVDLAQLAWSPTAFYTAAEGVTRLTDDSGNPLLTVDPPYDIDMYPVDGLTAPQQAFTPPATGDLTVAPALSLGAGAPDGRVVLTVKRRGALLAKKAIQVTNGVAAAVEPFTVPVTAGEPLFFDFSTLDRDLAAHVTDQSVQAGFDPEALAPVPSALHQPAEEGAFAQPYRGWAAIGYNGNRDRATAAIKQGDLVVDARYKDQLPTDVNPQRDKDAFAADPKITPPTFVQLAPAPARQRWEADENTWVGAAESSSSRLGGAAITLPAAADFTDVTAVPRVSRTSQISLTGSVGIPIGTVGGSIATGDSSGELDYLDLNGDRYPDIVGPGGVQYTDPTGQLGATRAGIPDGAVRRSSNTSGNASAGAAGRTISTGRGSAAPSGTATANTSQAGNDMPPLGVGGSHGTAESTGKFDLLDINGDGLPDRVYTDGRAALNLGYSFAAPEPWPGGPLNDGAGSNNGLNIGFNTDFYGLAGGASFSAGRNTTSASIADMNGDGLADRVFAGNPIRVALNTGSGFLAPTPFLGSLSGIGTDVNGQLGAGAYFEFHFCFAVIAGCIIVNPGVSTATGASRSELAIRDINGDGFADQLRSTKDSELTVAENQTGRTNLLKTVRQPLGGRFDLDYARDGNTADQPQSRFVLAKVTTNDGHPGDGADVQEATFRYAGGVYDRREREFRGYRSVVTEQRDPAAGDAVLRTVTREYRTDTYYTAGLLTRELTADGAGRPFTETVNSYQLTDVDNPTTPADPTSTTATLFPQLVRTDKRFYEGQPTPTKETHTDFSYDSVGNLIRSFDAGEPGAADDVETKIRYSVESGFCQDFHLLGAAQLIQVRGNGVLMRQRENTIECRTGDVTRNRELLADGTGVVTDFTNFDNGNIESVTYPPNATNQRYRVDYTYDPVLDTYPATVQDIFGYRSSSTYNAKYGVVETQTDENNQVIRNAYDTVGRLVSVTAPAEAGDNKPTISFEYHPEAATPYAISRHVDRDTAGRRKTDTIDTITFVDGYARMIQSKKDATVAASSGATPVDVMTVSGRSTLDALGRTVEQTYPITEPKGAANTAFNPGVDAVAPTRTSYDAVDRPIRTVLPDGTTSTTAFAFGPDRAGVTQFETAVTDGNGTVKRTYTDIRQQTTGVRESNPAGNQPTIWTSYNYDPLGQLTKVTDDHGNITTAAYDNLGRRTVVTTPDSGRTETVYDRADNVIRKITANLGGAGQAIAYDYDFTRPTAIRYPDFPANNVTYSYGAPGAAGNAANRITRITDAAGSVTREYGQLGEVTKETRVVHGVFARDTAYTTAYDYDSFGRTQQLTYPDGEVLSYEYDSGGLVTKATGVKAGRTYPYLKRLDYDKFGQRLRLQLGNGTTTGYTYNATDRRLATLKSVLPHGDTFQNQSYQYDRVGNITAISNDVEIPRQGGLDLGGPSQQTFSYDNIYRLTSSQGQFQPERNKVDSYQVALGYDSLGDLTTKSQRHDIGSTSTAAGATQAVAAPTPPAGTYDYLYGYAGTQPHAPSTVGPLRMAYDADGNLVSRTDATVGGKRRQFVWDEENRIACSDVGAPASPDLAQSPDGCAHLSRDGVRFTYDDAGQRVVKDAGKDEVTVYPNQTFSQRGGSAFKHIFVGDTRLVSKMVEPALLPEKNQFYFHPDQIGSTGYGTDADGRLVDHQQYFPSGETWVDETRTDPTPFQFTGKELDPETGLYYHGARYYDPNTSQWQSADPIAESYLDGSPGGGVFDPINLAAYTYGNDNPVSITDPTGLNSFFKGIGEGVVGGVAVRVVLWGAGAAAVALEAPVIATVATVAVGAVAVAGVAYTGYRLYSAESWSERGSVLAETAGAVVGGGMVSGRAVSTAREAGEAAYNRLASWWEGGTPVGPGGATPRSLGAAAVGDEPPPGLGNLRSGNSEAAATGTEVHNMPEVRAAFDAAGYRPGPTAKAPQPDYLTPEGGPVELKPYSLSGVRAGTRDVTWYQNQPGFNARGEVWTYRFQDSLLLLERHASKLPGQRRWERFTPMRPPAPPEPAGD